MALDKNYNVTEEQVADIAKKILPEHALKEIGTTGVQKIASDCVKPGVLCRQEGMGGQAL